MPSRRAIAIVRLSFLLVVLVPSSSRAQEAVDGTYSPGGWSTLHRDPGNRRSVEGVVLASRHARTVVLEGASVLTAPVLSPDGDAMYVATGRAPGAANLHAFDRAGRSLWRSAPWRDAEHGVDPCAVLSSPIVDAVGDVYLGDCNQLFAFHPDGEAKWVAALPPPRAGDWIVSEELPVNALTTAVFTRAGDVFGVTNFGDVVVFDRATGRRLNPPLRLPGHVPDASTAMPRPEPIFSDGLMDERIREWAWQLLVGGAMPSANTPAVDAATGRIFVAATSTTVGRGALYGLDLLRSGRDADARVDVRIAFATEMGPGSGSSPSLSPAGDRVYVSDEEGRFYSIDAGSGEIRWVTPTKAAAAAAAVGDDGTVYALQAFGPALIAIAPDGSVRWESDLEALGRAALPRSFWLGRPEASGNGNPTVVGDVVVVPVLYGYRTTLFGRMIPWPVKSTLVAIDRETGRGLRDVLELVDDSTGVTVVLPDGDVLNSLGTAITSAVAPMAGLARVLLPGDLEPLGARGGLQISRPDVSQSLP